MARRENPRNEATFPYKLTLWTLVMCDRNAFKSEESKTVREKIAAESEPTHDVKH